MQVNRNLFAFNQQRYVVYKLQMFCLGYLGLYKNNKIDEEVIHLMEKTAVLLVNLGTPDGPDVASVRTYLKEFLSDRRVIDLPKWKWLPILHSIVLQVRPKKSAKLYQSIWTNEGSPLMTYCEKQKRALQERFLHKGIRVSLAMTYGNPSVAAELDKLHKWGVKRLVVLPLFPQYSSTTTASIWDKVQRTISQWRDIPEIIFIRDYPDHPKLIQCLSRRVEHCMIKYGKPDALVLSYHGIPKRYADTGDDYPLRCQMTTEALRSAIPYIDIYESYQSKFGKEEWLEPSTDETLKSLAKNNKKHIQIMAPAFTADCLETLEELGEENKEIFLQNGGEQYHYLMAVNDDPLFIDCLEEIILAKLPVQQEMNKDVYQVFM